MDDMSVVTGAGPVGWTVAEQLAAAGHRVRVLTRSGSGPEHPKVERQQVDVSDERALHAALEGARTVFHCIHAAYTAKAWREELPKTEQGVLRAASGALVVFPESLYSYTEPDGVMTERGPRGASGGKRGVRTELLAARERSGTETVSVVASDLFGPRVRAAHAGERMVPRVLAGRRVRVLGSADVPHSFTYMPDYARAMIAAAEHPAARDTVLHAPTGPALTQRALVAAFAAAAGVPARVGTVPSWLVHAGARVPGTLRELDEMLYQFRSPFVMDSRHTQELLGLSPTPLQQAVQETLAWWIGTREPGTDGVAERPAAPGGATPSRQR